MIITSLHSFYVCLLSILLCAGHVVGVKKMARAPHSGPCMLIGEWAGKQLGKVCADGDSAQQEASKVFSLRVAVSGEGGGWVL